VSDSFPTRAADRPPPPPRNWPVSSFLHAARSSCAPRAVETRRTPASASWWPAPCRSPPFAGRLRPRDFRVGRSSDKTLPDLKALDFRFPSSGRRPIPGVGIRSCSHAHRRRLTKPSAGSRPLGPIPRTPKQPMLEAIPGRSIACSGAATGKHSPMYQVFNTIIVPPGAPTASFRSRTRRLRVRRQKERPFASGRGQSSVLGQVTPGVTPFRSLEEPLLPVAQGGLCRSFPGAAFHRRQNLPPRTLRPRSAPS